jgi:hypothetical protein
MGKPTDAHRERAESIEGEAYLAGSQDEAVAIIAQALADERRETAEACLDEIPTNWCDSLLTGPNGIDIPAGCPDIEKLLQAIAAAIRARFGLDTTPEAREE